jgi:hypothetical protein
MMMRMLEAGGVPVVVDGVRRADQDNPGGYYEYQPVMYLKQDSSWVAAAAGKAVKVVYRLLCDLPPTLAYAVIFMRRDLEEVVASQDEMLRRKGLPVAPGRSSHFISRFQRHLEAADAWLASRQNFRVLRVDYHRTLGDPRETCAQLKRFLGRDLDEARMQAVVTRALYRQRRAACVPRDAPATHVDAGAVGNDQSPGPPASRAPRETEDRAWR